MAKQYTPKENNARAAAALTSDPMAVVPPQAVELEEAVLGALMLEKDAVIEVQGLITPEAFYNEAHQIIYNAIVDLSMELKPIDLYTRTDPRDDRNPEKIVRRGDRRDRPDRFRRG